MNFCFDMIVYCILLFAIFFSCKRDATLEQHEIIQRLNNMRGIFAVQIVIGHVVRYEKSFLFPLGKFMIISVAFFFFISAWGMVYSLENKDNYLDSFLRNKVGYILELVAISFLFGYLVDCLVPISLNYYKVDGSFLKTVLKMTNWYLWELILFYFLFYLCYKYLRKYAAIIITLITALTVMILYWCGWLEQWYASSLAFPLGLLWGSHCERIMKYMNTFKGHVTTLVLVALGLGGQCLGEDSLIGMVWLRNTICIAGILILVYICQYVKINNNILSFLGFYSTEIYLFQFVYLSLFSQMNIHYAWKVILTLGLTLISAIILHPLVLWLRKLIVCH